MFIHTRGLGEKDLRLALALGEATGVDLPLAELALRDLAAGLGVPHTTSTSEGVTMDELRRKGLEKMNEVYGWEMPDIAGRPTSRSPSTISSAPSGPGRDCRCATSG